jgi:hypothetical protein
MKNYKVVKTEDEMSKNTVSKQKAQKYPREQNKTKEYNMLIYKKVKNSPSYTRLYSMKKKTME